MYFHLKRFMVPAILTADGSEFQQEEPEKDTLVL